MRPAPLMLGALAVFALVGSLVGASTMSAPALDQLAPDEWDERVRDLVDFVENERGLEFEHPVRIDFMSEEEFLDQLGQGPPEEATEEELEEIQDALPMMRSMGLMEGDFDVLETVEDYSEASILAFYDDDEKRIVVPTTDPTTSDNVTLVHELTHALQDQHFDLGELLPDPVEDEEEHEDRSTAILALVEGDANRIASAYRNGLPRDELDELVDDQTHELEDLEDDIEDVPSVLIAVTQAPYTLGEALVSLIAAEGGNDAVDRAFEDPPTTSIELLDPRRYADGEPFPEVDPPSVPDDVDETIDEGEFDALTVYYLLAERIDLDTALVAAETWNGGSHTVYRQDDRVCTRVALPVEGDDEDRLTEAFEEWADAMPSGADATVERDEAGDEAHLRVESCDPGPDVDLPNDRIDGALGLAVTRSFVAWQFVRFGGEELDAAWTLSECVMDELPPDLFYEDIDASTVSEDLIVEAIEACYVT